MVAVSLAAVLMAAVSEAARNQKKVAATVVAKGGDIYYRHQRIKYHRYSQNAPPGPAWLRHLVGDDYFQSAECIILRGDKFVDDDLLAIRQLSSLTDLFVAHENQITPGALRRLQAMLPHCYIEAPRKLY